MNQALIDILPDPLVNREISGEHPALFERQDLYIETVRKFVDGN